MASFRLLNGKHRHFGRTLHKGDVIESPRDLDKIFKNKFERLPGPPEPDPMLAKPAVLKAKPPAPKPVLAVKPAEDEPDPRGVEITDKVEGTGGLRVFQRGRWAHVYDGASVTPVNSSAIPVAEVGDWLSARRGGHS